MKKVILRPLWFFLMALFGSFLFPEMYPLYKTYALPYMDMLGTYVRDLPEIFHVLYARIYEGAIWGFTLYVAVIFYLIWKLGIRILRKIAGWIEKLETDPVHKGDINAPSLPNVKGKFGRKKSTSEFE